MGKREILEDGSLYLVLSEEYGNGGSPLEIARCAAAGGVDILQMREKHKTDQERMAMGRDLSLLCRQNGVIFIVNDDPNLAGHLDADGVHLGQEDMACHPIEQVRRIIGTDRMIGVSTHSLEQLRRANALDVDYIAFGPIFPTKTKDYHIGLEDIPAVLAIALRPVIFIGGINTGNLQTLLDEGVRNVALIRDIMQSEDVTSKVRWYKQQLRRVIC